jgi:hypothetical protein
MDDFLRTLILLVEILDGIVFIGVFIALIVLLVYQARFNGTYRIWFLDEDPDDPYLQRVGRLLWRFSIHRYTRYVLSWIVVISVAAISLDDAWHRFDNPKRQQSGNGGHTTIDFGGQWLMGRMLVEGQGRHLYDRHRQRQVLERNYPREDEDPAQQLSDAEDLMRCFMGHDEGKSAHVRHGDLNAGQTIGSFALPLGTADPLGCTLTLAFAWDFWQPATADIGGPLYPPINSLYFYPLGLLPPQPAYRLNQVLNTLLAFLGGLGISLLSRGRLWWPVAAFGILIFPGFKGSVTLGQNATLTLTITIWGWTLIARDRPGWGGVVWGLLAFKPVWALAFFLVPLLTRRWRTCFTMVATGVALAAATLPFIGGLEGWRVWRDWLHVGKEAAVLYNADENWIFLSRDLLSIPRRWLLDFEVSVGVRDANWLPPALLGWSIVLVVLETSVRLIILRKEQARAVTGPPAAFLFLFAWMMCFHFMYYDVLLAALPIFLLLTEPRRYLQPTLLAIRPVSEEQVGGEGAGYYGARLPQGYPQPVPLRQAGYGQIWTLNSLILTIIAILLFIEHSLHFLGVSASVQANFLQNWPILESWPIHQPMPFSGDWKGTPWETFCLMVLWLYCGWLWMRTPRAAPPPPKFKGEAAAGSLVDGALDTAQLVQLGTDVGRPH